MALQFTDGGSTVVLCGSDTSIDNLFTATVLIWMYADNVDNNIKILINKGSFENTRGWTLQRRGADGTSFALSRYRDVTSQTVLSSTAAITVNAWNFIGGSFDITSGAPKSYKGSLSILATAVTTSPANGSGTKVDDSSDELAVGNEASFTTSRNTGWPGKIAWVGVWDRVLTLAEVQSQQFRPRPTSGCVAFYHLGYAGTGTQPDWSGKGNNGTVTGATVADHVPIPFRRRGPLYVPYTAAAGGAVAFPQHYYHMQRSA